MKVTQPIYIIKVTQPIYIMKVIQPSAKISDPASSFCQRPIYIVVPLRNHVAFFGTTLVFKNIIISLTTMVDGSVTSQFLCFPVFKSRSDFWGNYETRTKADMIRTRQKS